MSTTSDSVLIVSATMPVPVDTGKRAVMNGLLRYFAERLGPERVHYALVGPPGQPAPPLPAVVHHLDRPGTRAKLGSVTRCAFDRSYSLQEAMLGSSSLRSSVGALVADLKPTIEVYDTLRMGQHAPPEQRAARRILYVDDLFSVRYERMLAMAARETVDMNPLAGFADNVPAPLRSLARRPQVYLPLLRFERDRVRRREAEIVHEFDVSLLVNADEVELLRQRSGTLAVQAVTPLLPPVRVPVRKPVDPPEFVFLGNLNLPHNDDAVSSFLRSAMSQLERCCPGSRLRVIGKNAGDPLRTLAARYPESVVLEGFVEDLDEAFSRATAVLAPLRFGSGVKIKMLDALARGVPVLATTVAIEGIPIRTDGSDGCVVEDDLARWPGLLAGLTVPTRASLLASASLDFFARTYGATVVAAQYDTIFGLTSEVEQRAPSEAG